MFPEQACAGLSCVVPKKETEEEEEKRDRARDNGGRTMHYTCNPCQDPIRTSEAETARKRRKRKRKRGRDNEGG